MQLIQQHFSLSDFLRDLNVRSRSKLPLHFFDDHGRNPYCKARHSSFHREEVPYILKRGTSTSEMQWNSKLGYLLNPRQSSADHTRAKTGRKCSIRQTHSRLSNLLLIQKSSDYLQRVDTFTTATWNIHEQIVAIDKINKSSNIALVFASKRAIAYTTQHPLPPPVEWPSKLTSKHEELSNNYLTFFEDTCMKGDELVQYWQIIDKVLTRCKIKNSYFWCHISLLRLD